MKEQWAFITGNLISILEEIGRQPEVGATFPPNVLSFADQVAQVREWLDVNELGLAYETPVAQLESHDFRVTGKAAVRLLEVGLLMGFKTERDRDAMFNRTGER